LRITFENLKSLWVVVAVGVCTHLDSQKGTNNTRKECVGPRKLGKGGDEKNQKMDTQNLRERDFVQNGHTHLMKKRDGGKRGKNEGKCDASTKGRCPTFCRGKGAPSLRTICVKNVMMRENGSGHRDVPTSRL